MAERIVRMPQVVETTGLGKSTIYTRIREGTFPTPIRIGKRSVGWPESVINDHVQKMIKDGKRKARQR